MELSSTIPAPSSALISTAWLEDGPIMLVSALNAVQVLLTSMVLATSATSATVDHALPTTNVSVASEDINSPTAPAFPAQLATASAVLKTTSVENAKPPTT